jgi:hypothetical protein
MDQTKQETRISTNSKGVDLSRREMLIGAGALMAGAAISQLGLVNSAMAAKVSSGAEGWPWPYEKVDPAQAGETAYHHWYKVFCSQAVTTGLFEQLRESVGEPWTNFPIESISFGAGGMLGWGLTCGAPVAGALVIGLAVPKEYSNAMIHDLLQWYSNTPMPVYVAQKPNYQGEIPKTVAESPLCHLSVGKWMKEADRGFGSDERRHRCASVTASVAYRTAELLNEWKDGTYKPGSAWNGPGTVGLPAQQNCMSCHGSDIPTAPR